MSASALSIWVGLVVLASGISFALLWALGLILPKERSAAKAPAPPDPECVYLFNDELLFDHSARSLPGRHGDALAWSDLRVWLAPRFAGLPARLDDLEDGPTTVIAAQAEDDTATLGLTRTGHITRIVLSDPPHDAPDERHAAFCARAELTELTDAFNAAPYPIWKTSTDGAILWQNVACGEMFDITTLKQHSKTPPPGDISVARIAVPLSGGTQDTWFEVQSTARDKMVLHHATDVTKIVRAEAVQKDFVQTLTKTFAYLTIGLAVFDRKRQLALFNPALIDLTALPVDFLSAQPDLMSFFDNLRNRNVMPEPRSYASWRAQINEVIDAAEGGLYQEIWTLPNDVTYRVTGRPHPDGAVAFLFEDISAEVMLAQRYRTQLDLRQSVLDSLPDAVMVIGSGNVLSFCNSAATRLLGIDPESSFADMSVADLMACCAARFEMPAVWSTIETALRQRSLDAPLIQSTQIAPGHTVHTRVEGLPGGARMLILAPREKARGPARIPAPAA